jgi:uncharacterized protein YecE (DUF72 family)
MAKKKLASGTLSLFGEDEGTPQKPPKPGSETRLGPIMSAYVEKNGERLKRWASHRVYFGTSSWKYPGWQGMVYTRSYPSKKVFDQECLTEYSEIFPTVCADFALYDFPDAAKMQMLHDQTTDGFKLSLKVTDRITIRRYPNLKRYGNVAGTENPDFLNVALFEDAFLKPIEALRKKRGAIIFEFSTFYPNSGMNYETYVEMMDTFLSKLPRDYEYAVELRNREFLTKDYLDMLRLHGVAHVLNNWTRMPPIVDQIQLAGVLTGKFSVARALLKPGRTYEEAVQLFQPYERIQEENPALRTGLAESVRRCVAEGKTLYAYVNNRAEGNSPKTIEAILDILDRYPVEKL